MLSSKWSHGGEPVLSCDMVELYGDDGTAPRGLGEQPTMLFDLNYTADMTPAEFQGAFSAPLQHVHNIGTLLLANVAVITCSGSARLSNPAPVRAVDPRFSLF